MYFKELNYEKIFYNISFGFRRFSGSLPLRMHLRDKGKRNDNSFITKRHGKNVCECSR